MEFEKVLLQPKQVLLQPKQVFSNNKMFAIQCQIYVVKILKYELLNKIVLFTFGTRAQLWWKDIGCSVNNKIILKLHAYGKCLHIALWGNQWSFLINNVWKSIEQLHKHPLLLMAQGQALRVDIAYICDKTLNLRWEKIQFLEDEYEAGAKKTVKSIKKFQS